AWGFRGPERRGFSTDSESGVFVHAGRDAVGMGGPAARGVADGPGLWARPDAGRDGTFGECGLAAFLLWRRKRRSGGSAGPVALTFSKNRCDRRLRASLPSLECGGAGGLATTNRGGTAGHHVDRAEHAQTGKVHGRIFAA